MIAYDPSKLYVCVTYTPEFRALLDNMCSTLDHPNIELHVNEAELSSQYQGFRSRGWFECLKRKLQFFYDFFSALPNGAVACSIDADVQFFKPQRLYELKSKLERSTTECYGQAEHQQRWIEKPNVGVANGGFFMLKKTPRVMDWLQAVLVQNFNRRFLGDQEYLNHFMRQKRVQYTLLPPVEFIHGGPVTENDTKLIDPLRLVMHHATYAEDVLSKQAQMNVLRARCNWPQVDWKAVVNTNKHVTRYVDGKLGGDKLTQRPCGLVVSRCTENVAWAEAWKNQFDVFIYSKCNETRPLFDGATWLTLPNVGRESHTYLTHIIDNYDKLHDVTIFLQGRIDDAHAYPKDQLHKYIEPAKRYGFSSSHLMLVQPPHWNDIDFLSLPKYAPKVRSGELRKGRQRLLDFATTFFGKMPVLAVSTYTGCFAASRAAIHRRPRSFYEELRTTIADHNDPEEGHYLERLWAHMFSGTAYVPQLLKIPEDNHDKFAY